MATYVSLVNWTEQGAKGYSDSITRSKDAAKAAEAMGGKFLSVFWTMGPYDVVAIIEFPDDESASAYALKLGAQGNVRTVTMRAYSSSEMERIIAKTK
ncbi:MAG: GYD family protein [Chloroflexi bacterium RIFCSPLOWO2_12_FULL_71_12]|nr:MAG: GYD family protein [Chloroflexi bacterium GWC2_70_10]OGO70768.1 MAG: GYD family protein [Chloroflexi bacterium RIFCSPLOWO2_02_FULL_71_16]OGO74357.1 MAG: GYD family protein [Chloroflexi bacterium RIFCSPLOWO2_12_FULL_71_12]